MAKKNKKNDDNMIRMPEEDFNLSNILDLSIQLDQEESLMDYQENNNDSKSFENKIKFDELKDYGNSSKMIQLDGPAPENLIIIGNKRNSIFKSIKRIILIVLAVMVFTALSIGVYICLTYKLVPGHVKGSEYLFENDKICYSLISRNHQPNIDELKIGDYILYTEQKDIIPIIKDYEILKVTGRNGHIIFCEKETGEKKKIEAESIQYIMKDLDGLRK